jgi:type III secretory pathway component EscR
MKKDNNTNLSKVLLIVAFIVSILSPIFLYLRIYLPFIVLVLNFSCVSLSLGMLIKVKNNSRKINDFIEDDDGFNLFFENENAQENSNA